MEPGTDVDFYYNAYCYLYHMAEHSARHLDEDCLICLVMYIENNATLGIAPIYEMMYSSLDDLVGRWCKAMEVSSQGYILISRYITDAVAAAPAEGSLRKWVEGSVLSRDFKRLEDVARFFTWQDKTLSLIFPNLSYRKRMYAWLTGGDGETAQQMLQADMAFNWHDKWGLTLLQRLAGRLGSPNGREDIRNSLESVVPQRMDAYLPEESKSSRMLTLRRKDGRIFKDVVFPTPLPQDSRNLCFIGQLVSYLDTTYVSGPGLWTRRQTYDHWDGDTLWRDVEENEKKDARKVFLTTSFGKRTSLYEDLYLTPGSPEECHKDRSDIRRDVPDLSDFMEWLKPATI